MFNSIVCYFCKKIQDQAAYYTCLNCKEKNSAISSVLSCDEYAFIWLLVNETTYRARWNINPYDADVKLQNISKNTIDIEYDDQRADLCSGRIATFPISSFNINNIGQLIEKIKLYQTFQ